MSEFDFTKPFTLSDLVTHYDLGDPHDPRISRPIVNELISKGYSIKVRGRKRVWAKWPAQKDFIMPAIP